MGASILEVDRHNQLPIAERIRSAWHTVGAPAKSLTVVAGGACAAIAAASVGESVAGVACGLSLLVLVAAALVDAVEHRLPNVLVVGAAVPVVIAVGVSGSADLVRSVALGALVVGGPLLVVHLLTPSGMGFGDVKAGAVLGAAMGLIDVEAALLSLVLGLGLGAAWGLGRRARSIALGPALVTGALVAALIGAVT